MQPLDRLNAIQRYTGLGLFRLAMRDLEMRGAGNLLGAKQSGHISNVGSNYTAAIKTNHCNN